MHGIEENEKVVHGKGAISLPNGVFPRIGSAGPFEGIRVQSIFVAWSKRTIPPILAPKTTAFPLSPHAITSLPSPEKLKAVTSPQLRSYSRQTLKLLRPPRSRMTSMPSLSYFLLFFSPLSLSLSLSHSLTHTSILHTHTHTHMQMHLMCVISVSVSPPHRWPGSPKSAFSPLLSLAREVPCGVVGFLVLVCVCVCASMMDVQASSSSSW